MLFSLLICGRKGHHMMSSSCACAGCQNVGGCEHCEQCEGHCQCVNVAMPCVHCGTVASRGRCGRCDRCCTHRASHGSTIMGPWIAGSRDLPRFVALEIENASRPSVALQRAAIRWGAETARDGTVPRGIEVRTAPTRDATRLLFSLVDLVTAMNRRGFSHAAGVHVHVDCRSDHNSAARLRRAWTETSAQRIAWTLVAPSPRTNFCAPLRPGEASPSRYHDLNVPTPHGTAEYRLHHATAQARRLWVWACLCVHWTHNVLCPRVPAPEGMIPSPGFVNAAPRHLIPFVAPLRESGV